MVFERTFKSLKAVIAQKEKQSGNNKNNLYFFYMDINDPDIQSYLLDDFNMEISLRMLSLKHQLAIRNKKRALDRALSLLNALFLKYAVSCYEAGGLVWDQLSVGREEYGKPFLANRNYSYNLSDEDGFVSLIIDFGDGNDNEKKIDLGLDLANPRDIDRFGLEDLNNFYTSDFRDIFTTNEVKELEKMFNGELSNDRESRLRYLSQYWALKESYGKYKGYGLHKGLNGYEFLGVKQLIKTQNYEDGNNNTDQQKKAPIDAEPFTKEELCDWLCDDVCISDPNVNTLRFMIHGDDDKDIVCSIIRTNTGEAFIPTVVRVNPVYMIEFVKSIQS